MPVVDSAVAPALRTMDIGGCGSRLALRLAGTTWILYPVTSNRHMTPRSRGAMRPGYACILRPGKTRAWGMPGAQCTRSLACEINKAHERSHHRSTGVTRHSP